MNCASTGSVPIVLETVQLSFALHSVNVSLDALSPSLEVISGATAFRVLPLHVTVTPGLFSWKASSTDAVVASTALVVSSLPRINHAFAAGVAALA